MTGIDLGFVPVIRGAAVEQAARDVGAAAFTTHGAIHLPDSHGDLAAVDNGRILAHEMTHVAQHRLRGAPKSGEVAAWESEAAAVASQFGGEPAASSLSESLGPGLGLRWTPDEGFVPDAPALAHEVLRLTEQVAPSAPTPSPAPDQLAPSGSDIEAQPVMYAESPASTSDMGQLPPAQSSPVQPAVTAWEDMSLNELERLAGQLAPLLRVSSVELDDPEILAGLAGNLLDPLTRLLRTELIHDRERRGALTEFH